MNKIFLTLILLSLLPGCVRINIDEGRVFQPQPIARKANTVDEMYLEWDDVFARASNYTFTNNINNDHSEIKITKEDFVPVELRHGFWADGQIAVTEFTTGEAGRPLVVHCGGNASDRYNSGTFFGLKVTPYADLIIFDYPGYGDSPGVPSAKSFEDMLEVLAIELNARQAGSHRPVILWGYSLGGFVCANLLEKLDRTDGIIIESSANDARNAAKHLTPSLLRPFVRINLSDSLADYDNVEVLKNYRGRVLVLAGMKDGVLPAKLSRQLVEGLRESGVVVDYHEFANGNHANLATLETYSPVLKTFFTILKQSKPTP